MARSRVEQMLAGDPYAVEGEGQGGISNELRKELEEKAFQVSEKMFKGGCKSMESYAEAVGYHRALRLVLDWGKNKAQQIRDELEKEQAENSESYGIQPRSHRLSESSDYQFKNFSTFGDN